jgi:hypothetical protein
MAGRKPRPDLLDELMPAPAAEAAAERPHPLPPGPSRRVVVKLQGSVADQARAAVLFLQGHGQPTATWPATSKTPSGSASSVTGPSSTRARTSRP